MADDLMSLIRQGKLEIGATLSHRGRSTRSNDATATVTAGGLRMNGRVFSSPSGAAKANTGRRVNGWTYWHLPDGKPLDSLRADGPHST